MDSEQMAHYQRKGKNPVDLLLSLNIHILKESSGAFLSSKKPVSLSVTEKN